MNIGFLSVFNGSYYEIYVINVEDFDSCGCERSLRR